MLASMSKPFLTLGLVIFGAVVCGGGIYVGETDDAPGAAALGILVLIGALAGGVKLARSKDAKQP